MDLEILDNNLYCVYCTEYLGDKMPKYYIGSTSIGRIKSGKYFGSVKSKQYKQIWNDELKNNRNLFSVNIIKICKSREEALKQEYNIQKKLDVVKSEMYINKSFASINGFFGMTVPKEYHPSFGKKWSEERKKQFSENLKNNKSRVGEKNGRYGKGTSDETKKKQSEIKKATYKGSGHPQFRYTDEIVEFIINERKAGKKFTEIAKMLENKNFKCSVSHIGNIFRKYANQKN